MKFKYLYVLGTLLFLLATNQGFTKGIDHDSIPDGLKHALFNDYSVNSNWYFSLSTVANFGTAFRDFELLQTGSGDLLSNRQASEEVQNYFAWDISFHLHHRDGLYFKLGLSYQQLNEQFKVDLIGTQIDTIPNGIIELIINAPGDTTFVRGQTMVERTFNLRQQNNNRIQFWNIPLVLGYSFAGERFSVEAEAGVIFNINLSADGLVLSENEIVVDQASILGPSAGLGLLGGLGINYFITEDWAIRIGGSFQIYPESVTRAEYPIAQSYTFLGANLGIRWYL